MQRRRETRYKRSLALKNDLLWGVIINPRAQNKIEFVPLFTTLSSIVKCESCDSNVTFGESNVRGLGFNLVVNCKDCEPRYVSMKNDVLKL